ncbi:MAG TPA: chemotaxis protein CheB [Chthoniobacterales bacterium]|jgi:two-component system chemotaxis response regulator CheB
MPKRDIVVIGTSAGGVEALQELAEHLPADYPGTIFIVMHIGPGSILPEILARVSKIPALNAEHNVRYLPNHIYIAPPNRHLIINDGVMQLDAGARENGSRPSIDPLFRSAARTHRERVAGVILTGTLDDGAAGLYAVKARGGLTIVQDPAGAASPEMPVNAMRHMQVDHCLPLEEIAPLLAKIATEKSAAGEHNGRGMKDARHDLVDPPRHMNSPPPNETQISLSCPECNGSLYEQKEGDMVHFMCHVGHSFSPESLTVAHKEALERALWTSVRTLNERVTMHRQFLRRNRSAGEDALFKRFEDSVAAAERDVNLLREIISRI